MISTKLLAALITVIVASGASTGLYLATQPQEAAVADEPVTPPSSSPNPQNITDSTIYAENSTIIAGEGSQIINPNPTPTTTPTPTPQPTLTITYLESTPDPADQTGQTTKYTFTITTNTQLTYTPNTVNTAIAHLANQYPLKTAEYNIITPIWTASTITNGKGNFDLYSTTELTELQLQTLAKDLQTALSTLL